MSLTQSSGVDEEMFQLELSGVDAREKKTQMMSFRAPHVNLINQRIRFKQELELIFVSKSNSFDDLPATSDLYDSID